MGVVGELEPFVDGDIDLSICRGLVNHFGSTGKMASVEVDLIVDGVQKREISYLLVVFRPFRPA